MRTLLALVLIALGCAACASAQPTPVRGPLTATPSARLMTGADPSGSPAPALCRTAPARQLRSGGRVGRTATAVDIAWLPGLNARDCRSQLVHADASVAARLAEDIDRLPGFPSEVVCPNDDGAAAQLVLRYARDRYEQVVIELSGCAGVSGGGEMTDVLRADLRPLAPVGWRQYLQP